MNITVLGGAGKMGCIAVQNLANDQRVDSVTIADLNMGAAKTVADYIASRKIHIEKVDIKKEGELAAALQGTDVCLNATVYYTNLDVMHACLQAGVHYTDMGGLFHTTRKQLQLNEQFASTPRWPHYP